MIRAALFLALALPAFSDETRTGRDRSRESSDWSRESSDVTRLDWSDDTRPMQVPEASPVLAVLLAGAALVLRRNGGAR